MPLHDDIVGPVRRSSLAALAWTGADGQPRATGVLALTRGAVPVVALPFARAALARTIDGQGPAGRVGRVALAFVEKRGTAPGFRALSIAAEPRLVVDTSGDLYAEELAVQELLRYPPARLLADSPLLMREHWWWLPRLVVELHEPAVTWLEEASKPQEARAVLVTADSGGPRVTRVSSPPPDALGPGSWALTPMGGPEPIDGPALLFDQDASFPDLERWAEWCWRGRVRSGGEELILEVVEGPARVGLPPTPGVLERWRRHRRLERACRRGLADWASGPTR